MEMDGGAGFDFVLHGTTGQNRVTAKPLNHAFPASRGVEGDENGRREPGRARYRGGHFVV